MKSALYQHIHETKLFNKNPANHALMEALIEYENAMDKGVTDTIKDRKRKHDDDDDDDEDPSTRPNQGKMTKRKITKEFVSSKRSSATKETPKGKAPSKGSKTGARRESGARSERERTACSASSEPDKEEDIDWIDFEEDDEKKDDTYDDKSIDLEMTDDEETDDEVLQGKEQVNDDEDEEMLNDEVEDCGKGNAEVSDAAKADAGKRLENQRMIQETAPVTTLPPPSISTIPPTPIQKTTTPIPPPPITTNSPIITSVVPEYDALSAIQLRVTKLEKDVSKLKKIDHFAKALATLKSQVPMVVEQYLGSKIGDDLQKVLQRHTADLIQKYSVKPAPESSKIQIPTEKSAS
ncbi:hypothetical protein Tco_0649949 [Tanacetum coccineum]